jgi:hypothetical protein
MTPGINSMTWRLNSQRKVNSRLSPNNFSLIHFPTPSAAVLRHADGVTRVGFWPDGSTKRHIFPFLNMNAPTSRVASAHLDGRHNCKSLFAQNGSPDIEAGMMKISSEQKAKFYR